jgi:hypothetical protein
VKGGCTRLRTFTTDVKKDFTIAAGVRESAKGRVAFSGGVPALAVVGPSGTVEDVYPHDRAGRFVAILAALNDNPRIFRWAKAAAEINRSIKNVTAIYET